MASGTENVTVQVWATLRGFLVGPQLLAFIPAVALGAYWFGGETALVLVALALPLAVSVAGALPRSRAAAPDPGDSSIVSQTTLCARAEATLARARTDGSGSVVLRVHFDAGADPDDTIRTLLLARVRSVLREGDYAAWADESEVIVLPRPNRTLDAAGAMSLARRIQAVAEQPFERRGQLRAVSAAIGLAPGNRLRAGASGADFRAAGALALEAALAEGVSGIRMQNGSGAGARAAPDNAELAREVLQALDAGRIRAWFQPQLCTDSGRIAGAEALARWRHPERGLVSPGVFLPLIEQANAMPRLSAAMLAQACEALASWRAAGETVPMVCVNLCSAELCNPNLPDTVAWELDRFGLKPQDLCIELLESVVLGGDDPVLRHNLQRLSDMGCRIDLDDFGTGQAPIATLQHMTVHRLKIDRSFVVRVDRDESQRKLVAGIVSLAESLSLDTVAEGVESHGEHATLAQLGVSCVQGFGIARPMPPEQMPAWIRTQEARIATLPALRRRATG